MFQLYAAKSGDSQFDVGELPKEKNGLEPTDL